MQVKLLWSSNVIECTVHAMPWTHVRKEVEELRVCISNIFPSTCISIERIHLCTSLNCKKTHPARLQMKAPQQPVVSMITTPMIQTRIG